MMTRIEKVCESSQMTGLPQFQQAFDCSEAQQWVFEKIPMTNTNVQKIVDH